MMAYAEASAKEFNLYSAGMALFPHYRAFRINDYKSLHKVEDLYYILLSLNEPDLSGSTNLEYYDLNPGSLSFTIGKLEQKTLAEVDIGSVVNDPAAYKIWSKIRNRIRSKTLRGAWFVNPDMNIREFVPTRHYTIGAKKAYDDGVSMIVFKGSDNHYLLEPISPAVKTKQKRKSKT